MKKDSTNSKIDRQNILDIVIDTINAKIGGATKYINQRDEENYRREFTDALNNYVAMEITRRTQ